jgi:hypothetical protein
MILQEDTTEKYTHHTLKQTKQSTQNNKEHVTRNEYYVKKGKAIPATDCGGL